MVPKKRRAPPKPKTKMIDESMQPLSGGNG